MAIHEVGMDKTQLWIVGGVLLVTVLILGGALYFMRPQSRVVSTVVDPSSLPGIQTNQGIWNAEKDNLAARLNAIGLPQLRAEGQALHIHQHLDIFVDGKPVTVPASFGINETAGFISAVHSHDTRGVIHVESPVVQDFTLGQVFDVWGVKFTGDCVGGFCASGDKKLKVFVNGAEVAGNPRELKLESHQQIVVAYGTDSELPNPIPTTFAFSPNE